MKQLKYPVLLWAPKYVLGNIRSERQLRVVGEMNLADHCFRDADLIDSSGLQYGILSVRRIGPTLSVWSLFPRYRTVRVDLELSEPVRITLDELKRRLKEFAINGRRYPQDQGLTVAEIARVIDDCQSIEELISSTTVFS